MQVFACQQPQAESSADLQQMLNRRKRSTSSPQSTPTQSTLQTLSSLGILPESGAQNATTLSSDYKFLATLMQSSENSSKDQYESLPAEQYPKFSNLCSFPAIEQTLTLPDTQADAVSNFLVRVDPLSSTNTLPHTGPDGYINLDLSWTDPREPNGGLIIKYDVHVSKVLEERNLFHVPTIIFLSAHF